MVGIEFYDVSAMYPNTGVGAYSRIMRSIFGSLQDEVQFVEAPASRKWLYRSLRELFLVVKLIGSSRVLVLPEERYLPLLLFRRRRRSVLFVHDDRIMHGRGWKNFLLRFCARLLPKSVVLVAASRVTYLSLAGDRNFKKNKVECVDNPVEECFFLPPGVRRTCSGFGEVFELLYVGSFESRKRVPDLIKLVEGNPSLRLTIVSSQFYAGRFEGVSSGNVVFLCDLSRDALIEAYRRCDAYITLSTFEGFGRGVVEAQASGVPVIYSPNNSTDYVIQGGGVALGGGTVSDLMMAVSRVRSNYDSLSRGALMNAARFSVAVAAQRVRELCVSVGR